MNPENHETWTEAFNDFAIPEHFRGGLERYFVDRIRPGGFLEAVLSNDLQEAAGRCDEEYWYSVKQTVKLILSETSQECWGSKEKVEAWLNG